MRLPAAALALVLIAVSARAQPAPAPAYAPPDAEVWALMVKALDELALSKAAHQQIDGILGQVQQLAARRAAAEKARPAPNAPPPGAAEPEK